MNTTEKCRPFCCTGAFNIYSILLSPQEWSLSQSFCQKVTGHIDEKKSAGQWTIDVEVLTLKPSIPVEKLPFMRDICAQISIFAYVLLLQADLRWPYMIQHVQISNYTDMPKIINIDVSVSFFVYGTNLHESAGYSGAGSTAWHEPGGTRVVRGSRGHWYSVYLHKRHVVADTWGQLVCCYMYIPSLLVYIQKRFRFF